MLLFSWNAHTAAMLKQPVKIVTDEIQHLNTGQIAVIAMDHSLACDLYGCTENDQGLA